jgi:hypothetical protein
MLQPYAAFNPTGLDTPGAFLPDRQDWLVAPVSHTRDSGALEESNWQCQAEHLPENDDCEVHNFGHWACGWFEIVIVRPDTESAHKACEIASKLEHYPVLNEDDFSNREYTAYCESWISWGADEFRRKLVTEFELMEPTETALDNATPDALREFYESLNTSGDWYDGDDGPIISRSMRNATRENVAEFLRSIRRT